MVCLAEKLNLQVQPLLARTLAAFCGAPPLTPDEAIGGAPSASFATVPPVAASVHAILMFALPCSQRQRSFA